MLTPADLQLQPEPLHLSAYDQPIWVRRLAMADLLATQEQPPPSDPYQATVYWAAVFWGDAQNQRLIPAPEAQQQLGQIAASVLQAIVQRGLQLNDIDTADAADDADDAAKKA
jgi:hypothetical protein